MITQKMKYALKALLVLADEAASDTPQPLPIEQVARRSGTPKRFLEHILLEIRDSGVIASRRGRTGGYVLVKRPAEVKLSELLRLIDGPLAPLPCLSRTAYQRCADCLDEETCRIRKTFADVFWTYLLIIDSLTLADLMRSGDMASRVIAEP
ncbi:Rrf2 family transcriptional regulator [Paracoccus sp. (in: a-proteobacteria)]|uniref:RrF2 family transcriptional regulator n=1 Tax=Paracoccus sp. TaxID=267 RepID=UPI0026DF7B1E|nr:Rrf2 family transcriptional regulator [Paracoccus sp. (in: a-proteobacteria)]MDO5371123.1 Rrf2 family transcriptional regulator [Paracoccus sp. (in: a-proteobacteria)]